MPNTSEMLGLQDMRKIRADHLTATVMNIVGEYITDVENDLYRKAYRKLYEAFYDAGADVMTDNDRKMLGLPERGPDGWTVEEKLIFGNRMRDAMSKPIAHIFETKVSVTPPVGGSA
jgi:hypothetical protein